MRYNMYRGMLVCALSFYIFSPPSFALDHTACQDERTIIIYDDQGHFYKTTIASLARDAREKKDWRSIMLYKNAQGSLNQWRKRKATYDKHS